MWDWYIKREKTNLCGVGVLIERKENVCGVGVLKEKKENVRGIGALKEKKKTYVGLVHSFPAGQGSHTALFVSGTLSEKKHIYVRGLDV